MSDVRVRVRVRVHVYPCVCPCVAVDRLPSDCATCKGTATVSRPVAGSTIGC